MSKLKTERVPDQNILRQAAEWFARISDESATVQETDRLQRWLAEHPDHARAWAYVQKVGARFQQATDQAGAQGTKDILKAAGIDQARRKALLGGGLSCVALALFWRYTPLSDFGLDLTQDLLADYSTATGQTRRITLADGGRIWLNSATALDVIYSDKRHIDLRQGEVLIETAKDDLQRPFIVTTRHGALTALGTRFSVYQQGEATLLAVFDGSVRITTRQNTEQIIRAGNQVRFNERGIEAPSAVQRARQSWVNGVLFADNVPLQAFIDELSRYQYGHIGVAEQAAEIKVIGAYPIDRPGHALRMLENALPIRISQPLPWWTEIEAR